ncbi:MAG: hypothetical protein LBQ50_06685 [Planctomycetaceae bacterium]|jgi:hypothetical protein|nr:hypothetical protein [Planctomycetaceae bacterium]
MEALRTIVNSERLAAIVDLPVELQNRDVEIIVFPAMKPEPPLPEPSKPEPEKSSPEFVGITQEQREQFRQHRENLVTEFQKNCKPKMTHEEFLEFLEQGPVADEETIRMQDEVRMEMSQWKIKW